MASRTDLWDKARMKALYRQKPMKILCCYQHGGGEVRGEPPIIRLDAGIPGVKTTFVVAILCSTRAIA